MKTTLNKRLVEKQTLTPQDVEELETLHEYRERMFDKMANLDPTDDEDKDTLILYSHLLESLEYNMQRVWKFPQNKDFHSWWFRVPYCTCPKMDNADPLYFGSQIISGDCPVHKHIIDSVEGNHLRNITTEDIKEL